MRPRYLSLISVLVLAVAVSRTAHAKCPTQAPAEALNLATDWLFDGSWFRAAECFEVALLEPSLHYFSALNLVEVYGHLGNRKRQLAMLTAAFAATTTPDICCDKAADFGDDSSISSELAFMAFDIAERCPSTLGRAIRGRMMRLAEHKRVDDVILVLEHVGARITALNLDHASAIRVAETASDAQFEAAESLPLLEQRCRLIGASWAGRRAPNSQNLAKIEACRIRDSPRPPSLPPKQMNVQASQPAARPPIPDSPPRPPPKRMNIQAPQPAVRPPIPDSPPGPPPIPYAKIALAVGAFADDDVTAAAALRINAGLAFSRPELRVFIAASVGSGRNNNAPSSIPIDSASASVFYFDVGAGVEFQLAGVDRVGLFLQLRAAFQRQQESCLAYEGLSGECLAFESIDDSGLLVAGQFSYRLDELSYRAGGSMFVGAELAWSEAMNIGGFLIVGYSL